MNPDDDRVRGEHMNHLPLIEYSSSSVFSPLLLFIQVYLFKFLFTPEFELQSFSETLVFSAGKPESPLFRQRSICFPLQH